MSKMRLAEKYGMPNMISSLIDKHAHIHSPEEIELLVSESHEGGLLDDVERQMLRAAVVPQREGVWLPADAAVKLGRLGDVVVERRGSDAELARESSQRHRLVAQVLDQGLQQLRQF